MLSDAYLVQIENSVKNAKNLRTLSGGGSGKIKWGVIVDLTGATLDYGRQFAIGMIDAVRFINDNGGINGKKIELIVHDDKYNIHDGQTGYKRLRDDEKVLGMHIQSTGTNLLVAPMATQDRMFMFSGGLMEKLLDPRNYPYYFTLCPTYSDMARICIKYIHHTWTIRNRKPKFVLICPDNVYGKEIMQSSKAYGAEIGVEVGPHQIVNWPTFDAAPHSIPIMLSLHQQQ
jgi:branched-chain amino acid transport system substrate-binding protein